jgi:hypothetical protein
MGTHMRKSRRHVLALLTAVGIVVCAAAWGTPRLRYICAGVVRGEKCFRGIPMSYWRDAIVRYRDGRAARKWPLPFDVDQFLDPLNTAQEPAVLSGDCRALPILEDFLRDPDEDIRILALQSDVIAAAAPEQIVPHIIDMVSDPCPAVRFEAVNSLGRFAGTSEAAMRELIRAAAEADTINARIIRKMYENSADIEQEVLAYSYSKPDARMLGQRACLLVFRSRSRAVPALLRALEDPRRSARLGALKILTYLGPSGHDAIPALQKLAEDEDPMIRGVAGRALSEIRCGE